VIYKHGNTWFDTVNLRVSVGERLFSDGSLIPPVPPAALRAVQAVVTRRCNLACTYCNVRLSGDSAADMSSEIGDRVVSAAAEAPRGRLVMVTGGEPLLLPELSLSILERVDPPKVIFTNAALVTSAIASRLKEIAVSPIVSLDGPEDIHNSRRSGSWNQVSRGLDFLSEAGVQFGLSTVVGSHNWKNISIWMQEMLHRFRPVSMGFNILHWTPGGFDPISAEFYADAMVNVFDTALKHGVFVDQIARRIDPLITAEYRHRDCSALGDKLVFHPDGLKSNCICGRSVEDWSGRIPSALDYCRDCPASGICGGGCAWDAIHLGGSGLPDKRHCIWVRRILDRILLDVQNSFPYGPVSREELKIRYGALVTRGLSTLTSSLGHGE